MKNRLWTTLMKSRHPKIAAALLAVAGVLTSIATPGLAESEPPRSDSGREDGEMSLSTDELAELVGPVALYPDDLLSIVLPAAAYPLQIVEAARFIDDRKSDSSLEPNDEWDDSVVALLNYPEVIELLNEDLQWTWTLGEAFVQQQEELLTAVEDFRERAHDAGNLKSDSRQVVTRDEDAIEIEPADPEVIYVPYYAPAEVVVYRTVPAYYYYPRPRPVYYYPYPSNYSFVSGYFFGVSTAYRLHWGHQRLFTHHYWHDSHPYYGRTYYRPHYSRHYHRHGSWNAYRNVAYHTRGYGAWRPGPYRGARPAYRTYRPRHHDRIDRRDRRPRVRTPESANPRNVYTDRNYPRRRPQLQGPRNNVQATTTQTGKERVRVRAINPDKPRRHSEQRRAPEPTERDVAALLQRRSDARDRRSQRAPAESNTRRRVRGTTQRTNDERRVTARQARSEPRPARDRTRRAQSTDTAPRVTALTQAPRASGRSGEPRRVQANRGERRVAQVNRSEPQTARQAPRKTDKKSYSGDSEPAPKASSKSRKQSRSMHRQSRR